MQQCRQLDEAQVLAMADWTTQGVSPPKHDPSNAVALLSPPHQGLVVEWNEHPRGQCGMLLATAIRLLGKMSVNGSCSIHQVVTADVFVTCNFCDDTGCTLTLTLRNY